MRSKGRQGQSVEGSSRAGGRQGPPNSPMQVDRKLASIWSAATEVALTGSSLYSISSAILSRK